MKTRLFIVFFLLLPWAAQANCVVGATGSVGAGTCLQAGHILIATAAATSTSNITFSSANFVNTYPRLQLVCSGLTLSGTGTGFIYVNYGTGATPTWQQANYTASVMYTNGTAINQTGGTANLTDVTAGAVGGDIPGVYSFEMLINNPSSTTVIKHALWRVAAPTSGVLFFLEGAGYWAGTGAATTPITGVQMIAGTSGGPGVGGITITGGTCSLYGMP